jgi:hypothetical protein
LRDDAAGDRVAHGRKDDRDRPRLRVDGSGHYGPACQDDVGLQAEPTPARALRSTGRHWSTREPFSDS